MCEYLLTQVYLLFPFFKNTHLEPQYHQEIKSYHFLYITVAKKWYIHCNLGNFANLTFPWNKVSRGKTDREIERERECEWVIIFYEISVALEKPLMRNVSCIEHYIVYTTFPDIIRLMCLYIPEAPYPPYLVISSYTHNSKQYWL